MNQNQEQNTHGLVPVENPETDLMPAAPKTSRLRTFFNKVPRPQDPQQRKYGAYLIRFFAIIIILTLVAKGTAGATLAMVTTSKITSGEITQVVNASGNVSTLGSNRVETPAGLTVQKVLAANGQKVKPGDPLLQFNPNDVTDKIAREQAALKELQAKLKNLQTASPRDKSGLASAQDSATWAQQDYDNAKARFDREINDLQTALNNANAQIDSANAHLANLPAEATEEERTAAQQAVHDAEQKRNEVQASLNESRAKADSTLQELSRALETARQNLSGAQTRDQQAKIEDGKTATSNRAEAETVRLDIEQKNRILADLGKIAENNGQLLSSYEGLVQDTLAEGSTTQENGVIKVSDTSSGFEAEAILSKESAKNLNPGTDCEITPSGGFLGYSPSVKGTLLSLSPPDENGQVTAKIKLPNGDWKQNDNVQIKILKSKQNYTTCVPVSALHMNNQNYFIYVLEERQGIMGTEKVAVSVPVTLLAKDATNAAIEPLAPLGYEEQVISFADRPLENGSRVRVKES